MTEIDKLYPVEGSGRNFDAVVGAGLIMGRLSVETFDGEPRTIVYYDREEPLDGIYAVRNGGSIAEIADDATAEELIVAGIDTTNQ